MALRVAIGVLSAAVLAYEILLTRLFSIVHWHHFAPLAITVALLGYGASGTLLAIARRAAEARFATLIPAACAAFGVTSVGGFVLAQRLPFEPLALVWDGRQLAWLALLQLALTVPFLCAASAVGLALLRFRGQIPRLYRADLFGAGSGAALVVAALWLAPPGRCLLWVSAAGFAAGALVCLDRRFGAARRPLAALLAAAALLPAAWPGSGPEPRPSQFKGLSRALRLPGARVVEQTSSPLAVLSVVESPRVPLRIAPGLSLGFPGELPPQLGLFSDGDGPEAIDRGAADDPALAYLEHLPEALPWAAGRRRRVALVGAAGGSTVAAALRLGATEVHLVEPDPRRLRLLRETLGAATGGRLDDPRVTLHRSGPRAFLARRPGLFDLIQLAAPGDPAAGGGYGLAERYAFTIEAFEAMLRRLAPGGLLAVGGPLSLPPRDSLKLFATAVEAQRRLGVSDPAAALALVRSWDRVVLLMRSGPFPASERAGLRAHCRERAFDLAWLPGLEAGETNRYNVLREPSFYLGARRILETGPEAPGRVGGRFDLRPATDDRPYFSHFFRWRSLPELWSLRRTGGAALLEWGYVFTVAALAEAALAGAALIVLPLVSSRLRRRSGRFRWRWAAYFLCLGLGFLIFEIAFLQRFLLFLDQPVYALAVVLGAFLVFAGLGSGFAGRRIAGFAAATSPALAAVAVAAAGIVELSFLPRLLDLAMGWSAAGKVGFALLLLAPQAFLMGLPFPLGLERIGRARPGWIPWAWAINGWASVVAALLAHLLSVHLGLAAVTGLACGLYLAAAWAASRAPALSGA